MSACMFEPEYLIGDLDKETYGRKDTGVFVPADPPIGILALHRNGT